jgi:hypothetical protein
MTSTSGSGARNNAQQAAQADARAGGGVGGAGVHDALAEVLVIVRLYIKALLRPCIKDLH